MFQFHGNIILASSHIYQTCNYRILNSISKLILKNLNINHPHSYKFLISKKNHYFCINIYVPMSEAIKVKTIFHKRIFWDVDFENIDYDKSRFCHRKGI
jgi:hypothetical protein